MSDERQAIAAIGPLELQVTTESWPLAAPFRISGRTMVAMDCVVVALGDGRHVGRGEAQGVYYHGETATTLAAQIEAVRPAIEAGIDHDGLQRLLPRGGARNAVDCALWELTARRREAPVWSLAGLAGVRPVVTTWTVGAADPAAMATRAGEFAAARALKIKLIGDGDDAARVAAVRAARPEVWLGVDANQGLTRESLAALMPALVDARVALIEQPVVVGDDASLRGLAAPIPLAADESALDQFDLPALVGLYDVVNIKLDKCGGLTAAMAMAAAACAQGFRLMVGNMLGTSLAMAPSFIVGQLCEVVDLDGPLLLAHDRTPGVVYADGLIDCADGVWGATANGR